MLLFFIKAKHYRSVSYEFNINKSNSISKNILPSNNVFTNTTEINTTENFEDLEFNDKKIEIS